MRLSLYHAALMAVSLAGFGLLVYAMIGLYFRSNADRALVRQAEQIVALHEANLLALSGDEVYVLEAAYCGAFIFDSGGRLLWRHGELQPPSLEALARGLPPNSSRFVTATVPGRGRNRYYVAHLAQPRKTLPGAAAFLVVGWNDPYAAVVLQQVQRAFIGGGLLVIVLTSILSSRIAARALQPLVQITQTIQLVAERQTFNQKLEDVDLRRDELGRLAVTFNNMLDRLRESYDQQRQFVADASHALQTPVTTLLGHLDLLKQWEDLNPPDRQAILEHLHAEAQRINHLAAGLLALARADAQDQLDRSPVELDRVVLEAYRRFQSRRGAYTFEIAEFEPVMVAGDAASLREALSELLYNAFRYTPPGGTITLALRKEGREALVSVSDTGIGIREEELPLIFQRFYRGERARLEDSDGSGLGLAIVRRIVERHGGKITVTSQPGQGSTFTIRLPRLVDVGSRRRRVRVRAPTPAPPRRWWWAP